VKHALAWRRCILWHFKSCLLTGETHCNSNVLWIRKTMLIFQPQLINTAVRSLCDSWATCSFWRALQLKCHHQKVPDIVLLHCWVQYLRTWPTAKILAMVITWHRVCRVNNKTFVDISAMCEDLGVKCYTNVKQWNIHFTTKFGRNLLENDKISSKTTHISQHCEGWLHW